VKVQPEGQESRQSAMKKGDGSRLVARPASDCSLTEAEPFKDLAFDHALGGGLETLVRVFTKVRGADRKANKMTPALDEPHLLMPLQDGGDH